MNPSPNKEQAKTAMQELIEGFEAIDKDGYNIAPKAAIELCKQLLKKEKEQMRHSFIAGRDMSDDFKNNESLPRPLSSWRKYKFFDDYFKIYNQKP